MGIWYVTREQVKRALDIAETARADVQVDRAIEAGSRMIDGHAPGAGALHRRFYPELATRTFDWPNESSARPWRLWLYANELVSATSVVVAGQALAPSDYLLRPDHGPPYNRIEIDLSGPAAFGAGATHQRAIAITGVWYWPEDPAAAGQLAASITTTAATTLDVTDGGAIGVGSLLRIGDERLVVTGRQMLDTGQNLGADLAVSAAAVTVPVADGTAYHVDEVLLVDGERMLVVDIAGNNVIVRRGWDGSPLAAHSSGADVYASRRLTVARGQLGTLAATHDTAAPIVRHVVPGLVAELALAEALNNLEQGRSGYARTVGSGETERESSGRGLRDIRAQAYAAYGRKARIRAV